MSGIGGLSFDRVIKRANLLAILVPLPLTCYLTFSLRSHVLPRRLLIHLRLFCIDGGAIFVLSLAVY